MRFEILTLFPHVLDGPLGESILGRAREAGLIEVVCHDLRRWAQGKHRQADDTPFGGGDGMVMKADVLIPAIRELKAASPESPVVLLCPQGRAFTHELAREWAAGPGLILVCGHYAGVDERVRETVVDVDLSIGDYVLSGGEPAAWVVVDAVARQVPGVLGNEVSADQDSFPARLEAPQYTRPAEFEGQAVPPVLVSGNHELIRRWRKQESLRRTRERRPDLLAAHPLDEEERELLQELDVEPDPAGEA